MQELVQASAHCYYLPGPTRVGIVQTAPGEACLIDSGGDKSAARALLRQLTDHGWTLRAIYNTHSHADHIGGNAYLQARTGCPIYAPDIEQTFTCHPELEPAFLGGGYPPPTLRSKFLQAPPSKARLLTPESLPPGWEIIPLPGHSFGMVGFRTPEDVVYLADCVASPATLDKYRFCFIYDVASYLHTLNALRSLDARLFIPAHAEPTTDLSPLIRANIDHVHSLAENICALCAASPHSVEDIVCDLYTAWQLPLSFEQHALASSTIRSYLAYLAEQGRLAPACINNRLYWNA